MPDLSSFMQQLARFLRREGYHVFSSSEKNGTWKLRCIDAKGSRDILAEQQGELFTLAVEEGKPETPHTGMDDYGR